MSFLEPFVRRSRLAPMAPLSDSQLHEYDVILEPPLTAPDVKYRPPTENDLFYKMLEFSESLRDSDRPGLRAFARLAETKRRPVPMAQMMLFAEEYELAVEYFVPLLQTSEHPSYVMWKLSETLLGGFSDYRERSRAIGRAYLDYYDAHPESRAFIARLFRHDIAGLRASLAKSPGNRLAGRRSRGPMTDRALVAKLKQAGTAITGRLIRISDISDWKYDDGLSGMPTDVRALHGTAVTMVGYLMPMENPGQAREYYLVRSWLLGEEDERHERVHIRLAEPVEIGLQQGVWVEGTLRIEPFKPQGYTEAVFQVPDARVTPIE